MLRSHARNGNEFRTPAHRWLPAKHWDAWFLNSSKSKLVWNSWNLACYHGAASTCRSKILSHLGQVWVYASHKPELLTTSMMVFGRERPAFGDETISISSYSFHIFSHVNIELEECCVNFCDFWGSFGHFYALTLFSMHLCAQFKFRTTCTCSSAYKLVEKSNMCPLVDA